MAESRPYHALTVVPDIEEKILAELAKGHSLKMIAAQFGVSDVAVLHRVQSHPDYKRTARIGLKLRMDKREEELEAAADNVSVTRSNHLLTHARWLNERLNQEEYGPKQTLLGDKENPLLALDPDTLVIEAARAMAYILHAAQTVEGNEKVIHSSNVDAAQQLPLDSEITPEKSDNGERNQ